jgi:hypothetical protein
MFMICLYTEFHMFSSSGSLVIVIKPKAKENIFTAVILSFYIVLADVGYFSKIYYHTLFEAPVLLDASVPLTS